MSDGWGQVDAVNIFSRVVIWLIVSHAPIPCTPPAATLIGVGTIFSRVDHWNPDPRLACSGDILDDNWPVVALPRPWPCGATIRICNVRTGRCTLALVGDRGPRRALVDMTPGVARAIGHNGMENVGIRLENP